MTYEMRKPYFEAATMTPNRRSPAYVHWVQTSLNKIDGAALATDGVFGPRTRRAILTFQQRRGLVPDGVVGARTEAALMAAGASAPPQGTTPVTPPSKPVSPAGAAILIKTESMPPRQTLYSSITLGGEQGARPMTGIFVPDGYRASPSIDLVLYLHGHKVNAPTISIDTYWTRSRYPHFALREATNDARRNVILVAPTLGTYSQSGWLTCPGGLDRFTEHVLDMLQAHGPYNGAGSRPVINNMILSCHSGGGVPMRLLAHSNDRVATTIRECWGFDCLYNKADVDWLSWARAHQNRTLFVHYLGSTAKNSTWLRDQAKSQGLRNVTVSWSTGSAHNNVPMAHWRDRLASATFLSNF